jgi:transcriptional regulator with XRE-family HTH domain
MTGQSVLVAGMVKGVGSQKEAARRLNVTECLVSKIRSGERNLAPDLMPKAAQMHPLAGLGVAFVATAYRIFEYITGNRDPQTMLRRVEKEDIEADNALKGLGIRLIDKNGPEDLTEEDRIALTLAAKEMADRIKHDFNLLVELEDRYKLGLMSLLVEKEKSPKRAAG